MVLRVKEEVGVDDRDAGGDSNKDEEDQKHEAVHIVDLVRPEGGEDEVHLDEDRAKWKNTADENDCDGLRIPRLLWNLPGDRVDAAGEVGLALPVPPDHGPEEGQGKDEEEPDGDDGNQGAKVDGPGAGVGDGNNVVENGNYGDHSGPEDGGGDHGPDPVLATVPRVVTSREEARDNSSEGVNENGGC